MRCSFVEQHMTEDQWTRWRAMPPRSAIILSAVRDVVRRWRRIAREKRLANKEMAIMGEGAGS
jgi:hypothetical protein